MYSLVLFTNQGCWQNEPNEDIAQDIIGTWKYQYSEIDGQQKQITFNKHCPAYKMVFAKCNDAVALDSMPDYIIKMRENNILQNIKCITYDDEDSIIDTYYPVASEKGKDLGIANFGLKYKSYYTIDYLSTDTLVVNDGKMYNFDDKEYSRVRHFYLKE